MNKQPPAHKQLDVTGLICPEPVMVMHSTVSDMHSGEVLEVRATDPSTQRDIPKFCQFLGHELLHQECIEEPLTIDDETYPCSFVYLIRCQ